MNTRATLLCLSLAGCFTAAHAQHIQFHHPEEVDFLPGEPTAVASGDLNGDGHQDLLVCYSDPGGVYWYESDEADMPGAAVHLIGEQLANPEQPVLVDLEGDGDLDLVLLSPGEGVLAVYENQVATFMYHEVLVDEALLSLCVTDLNSDGLPDLVCGYASGQTLRRCLQVPGLHFTAPEVLGNCTTALIHLCSVDLDTDGAPDLLAMTSNDGYLLGWRNLGHGEMGAEEQLSENRNRMKCLDIADLDEDGDPDIVSFCMSQTCLMWYENRLSDEGTWLSHRVPANTGRSMEVQLLDWNADGAPDLLSGSSNGEIYFSQNPQQTGADWPTQLIRTNAGSISALASLDPEEGQLSGAVVASMDQVSVVRRSDQELVFRPVAYKPRSATSATMCDTDLDGEPEIIVCDAADSCLILYDPTLSHAGCYRLTTIAECIPATLPFFSADLDGDEDLDLVFGRDEDGYVQWFENGHPACVWTRHELPTQLQPERVCIHDIDGDGDQDLFVGGSGTGILMWNSDGAGSMVPAIQPFDQEDIVYQLEVGDLNGDGLLDIAASSPLIGFTVWWGTAGGWIEDHFGYEFRSFAGEEIRMLDVEGDGDLDLWAYGGMYSRPYVRTLVNHGIEGFDEVDLPFADLHNDYGPVSMCDADLDGDLDFFKFVHTALYHYENLGGWTGMGLRQSCPWNIESVGIFEWVTLPGDPRPSLLFCSAYTGMVMIARNESTLAASPVRLTIELSENSVLLGWEDPRPIDHWLVYRVPTPWAEPSAADLIATVYSPSYLDHDALQREQAWYRVVAVSTLE